MGSYQARASAQHPGLKGPLQEEAPAHRVKNPRPVPASAAAAASSRPSGPRHEPLDPGGPVDKPRSSLQTGPASCGPPLAQGLVPASRGKGEPGVLRANRRAAAVPDRSGSGQTRPVQWFRRSKGENSGNAQPCTMH